MLIDRVRATATWGVALAVLAVLVLSVQQVAAPQRSGVMALAQIGAPHLTLLCILALPLALVRAPQELRMPVRLLRISLIAVLAIGVVRFGPGLISLPPPAPPPGATAVTLTSWNLFAGEPSDATVLQLLQASGSDVIGLQELTPRHSRLLTDDPVLAQRYPFRILHPRDGSLGMGLLSRFPMIDLGTLDLPPTIWARLDLGVEGSVVAVLGHPLPGAIGFAGDLPVGFDADRRDDAIRRLRSELVDPALARGERVLLFGDFNVTDREPAYGDLTVGLTDAHAEVGLGPGSTWRPASLAWLAVGLLRIDYVFAGPGVLPVAIAADRAPRGSDHCIVQARLSL